MATKVSWDVDNLKVLYRPTGNKVDACCCLTAEYSVNDCCCFLDPSTDAWSSGTTYAVDDLAEYSGKTWSSLQNNNLNHAPAENTWWHKVSDAISCGNTNWDAYPPYGGPGKTPKYITATFSGITGWDAGDYQDCFPTTPNRTFVLIHSGDCEWGCFTGAKPWDEYEEDEFPIPAGWDIQLDLHTVHERVFCRVPPFEYTGYNGVFFRDTACSSGGSWSSGYAYKVGTVEADSYTCYNRYICTADHTSSSTNKPGSGADWEDYWTQITASGDNCGFGIFEQSIRNCRAYIYAADAEIGMCQLSIGANIDNWSVSTAYVVGNVVLDGDTAYICKSNHTSSLLDEPGVGTNWTTYWDTLTTCA
jgi:hypothetical protein